MKEIKGIRITTNASLKNLNTYKIESSAKYLIHVETLDGLINILKYLRENKIKHFILGAGSNIVIDNFFDGAVIKLDGLKKISVDKNIVTAESGAMMASLSSASINYNLTGLEWAINIPGTVGGSIVGNAGAYNKEIFDDLVSIKVLDESLNIKELKKDEVKHSYRHTDLKEKPWIVLEATFKLENGNKEESLKLIMDRKERRLATQPLDMPSAGSVFRNPENDHAGRLIEECGLKGKKIGGAMVSLKHANFIVNTGNATSNDVKNLIKLVHDQVKEKFGVDLVLEQEIIDWK